MNRIIQIMKGGPGVICARTGVWLAAALVRQASAYI
jgi:hypothetical protein